MQVHIIVNKKNSLYQALINYLGNYYFLHICGSYIHMYHFPTFLGTYFFLVFA